MGKIIPSLVIFLVSLSTPVFANSIAQLTTPYGVIEIELYQDKAPLSVNSFIDYVNSDNEKGFYRIVRADNDQGTPQIDVVQGGFVQKGASLPGIKHESTQQTGLTHKRGAISLARAEVGTGSAAHFFIVVKDSFGLDHGANRNKDKQGFAVFGQVIKGMEILDQIHQMPKEKLSGEGYTKGQIINSPVQITNAYIKKR
ncbi:peptidylprolyl isomerase [Thalassotalea ganghwensis]